MAKEVVGVYHSPEEAMKGINIYELKGHHSKNIIALTNENDAETLDKLTNVTVQTKTLTNEDSFKVKGQKIIESILGNEDVELDSVDKLVDFGLTTESAQKCIESVKAGNIVVLADNELRMGQTENPREKM